MKTWQEKGLLGQAEVDKGQALVEMERVSLGSEREISEIDNWRCGEPTTLDSSETESSEGKGEGEGYEADDDEAQIYTNQISWARVSEDGS